MANWNDPILTTAYATLLTNLKDRDVDAGTLFLNAPTNPVTGMIRYLRASDKFQEWNGAAWVDKVLSIAGGGTGGATAAAARTALGIGTMGTQNSNAIAVTGGTLTGITQLDMSSNITWLTDNSFDLATFAKQTRKGYFKSALVIPVGVDKYATS